MRRDEFLPFAHPAIGEEEIREVVDTLRSQWITTGPKTQRFQEEFAAYVGASDAAALSSCTAALHTALAALGIGSGDEVITTPMTFASTVHVIEHVGARPVMVDVEPDTLNIDPYRIEAAITSRTRAIMPVHYAGHPVDLGAVMSLASSAGLAVIEDAAHALAASYEGRPIGSSGNPVAFSFYATKNLTTGEGGMLVGAPEFLQRVRVLSLHGIDRDAWRRYESPGRWWYEVVEAGFKYNMTDLQASIGLWQLRKLESFQVRRREIVERYQSAFLELESLETPVERPEVRHAWHLYVIRLRPEALSIARDTFIEELTARNIGASVHFIPVHIHPLMTRRGYTPEDFPIAYSNYLRMISLPLHPGLSDEDVDDVINAVLDIVEAHRR
jgi:dTDP-4-amino-4,6-dideoxygalactose transaminase